MTASIKYVELPNSVTLPYIEQGDASGIPLLLLHGFAGTWQAFKPVLAHLSASLHVFALTLRGHGEASKPQDDYSVGIFASDVAAFMDALQIEASIIVGHSMGAAVAQRLAMDHPEKTLGLVLFGACVMEPAGPKMRAFWESTVSKLSDPVDPAFVQDFLESTLVQPIPQAFFEDLLQHALEVPAHVWRAAWKARLEAENGLVELDKITAPTLIAWGDHDTRCPRRHQTALTTSIPDSRLIVYSNAGHSLHYEEPERFASDLSAFVVQHSSALGGT
jgi:pimeloyl-ACP methyl ester carboxylesterase